MVYSVHQSSSVNLYIIDIINMKLLSKLTVKAANFVGSG